MSILDAAKLVADSANLDLTVKGDTITLKPKPGAKPPPIQRSVPGIPGLPGSI
jgi:hypothetical protein